MTEQGDEVRCQGAATYNPVDGTKMGSFAGRRTQRDQTEWKGSTTGSMWTLVDDASLDVGFSVKADS